MEIEITDKKNNPFLKRTEVHFTVIHENQKTPNQSIIRNELANSLNTKKENIIIDNIQSHYGIQQSKGYAKVYSSRKVAEDIEKKHLLKRNKMEGKKSAKKEDESAEKATEEKQAAVEASADEEKPAEEKKASKEEKPKEEA